MKHPNVIDKIILKFNPHYLYPNEYARSTINLNVAIIHRVSTVRAGVSQWKIMDYLNLKKGSLLKYLGSGKHFKLAGDLSPDHSLFEIMDISTDKLFGKGDILALTKTDRKFIIPTTQLINSPPPPSFYFTAENQ